MILLQQKFGELIDLYKGKKMHDKALELLKQYVDTSTLPWNILILMLCSFRLSDEEEDMLDKLQPSIFYLQRLGPEYLELIFMASRWIFDADRNMAFEVGPVTLTCLACPNLNRSSPPRMSSFLERRWPTIWKELSRPFVPNI